MIYEPYKSSHFLERNKGDEFVYQKALEHWNQNCNFQYHSDEASWCEACGSVIHNNTTAMQTHIVFHVWLEELSGKLSLAEGDIEDLKYKDVY